MRSVTGSLHSGVIEVAPVTIDLRIVRLALIAGTFAGIVVLLTAPFYGHGVTLRRFSLTEYSSEELTTLRDDYNSYSGNIVSAVATSSDWIMGTMLPVVFLAFASRHQLQTSRALTTAVVFTAITLLIKYLINNGLNAVNVQIVPAELQSFIAPSDLKANTDALDTMNTASTNVSSWFSEDQEYNYLGNTVLRNVVAPIALWSPLVCSSISPGDTSQFATGIVQSFGFPIRSWQNNMLVTDTAEVETPYKICLSDDGDDRDLTNASLPMNTSLAANIFIHGMHVSQYFFRWASGNSSVFDLNAQIQASLLPDEISSNDTASRPRRTVAAAELWDLLPPDRHDEQATTAYFINSASAFLKQSLDGAVNISIDNSTMAFSHVRVWDNIDFDAVTFEVQLRSNFYYRKLVQCGGDDDGDDRLCEDTEASEKYSSVDSAANSTDPIYFDLDTRSDCGPNPGLCVMPRVQEYDFYGSEYQPDPQIKATGVCLNAEGTEEFQIDYSFVSINGNSSEDFAEAYWACNAKSTSSFWIVSLGSRIEGDSMYDGPAPDADDSSTADRATIVNPRKIYSLTVGRFAWDLLDLEDEFDADCAEGDGQCRGIRYMMDLPVENAEKARYNSYMLVGEDNIPMDSLTPYPYNATAQGRVYLGQASTGSSVTCWLPLVSLTRPSEDREYTTKGDILFAHHFDSFAWSAGVRSGENCSAAAEDYLNHVVNNHYYMGHGLQPSYTAGMYFLFQNGVVRSIKSLTDGYTVLDLDGNVQYMDLSVSIPTRSIVITFCGVALILISALLAAVATRCGRRPLLNDMATLTPEVVADLMLNYTKYPPLLLARRFDTSHTRSSFQQFRIGGLTLHHEAMGTAITLPMNAKPEDTIAILEQGRGLGNGALDGPNGLRSL